jgi:lactose/L-arabinose transport system ATP-binding protein
MSNISLKNVNKYFGTLQVIHDVNLEIADGEFIVFVGPSGCGKSTLLRMISGLEDVTSGIISIADEDVTHVDPAKRNIAMVFQSYALYPHFSVEKNLNFALRMAGEPSEEVVRKVKTVSELLQLGELMGRKPAQLSGGQRQRVAIGRALVRSPKVFLFDEPLSNLDAELRVQMRVEIAQLQEDIGITSVYVTHDQVEAMTLADRIVVLNAGAIEQVGKPLELYDNPNNLFVANFIGSPSINLLNVDVVGSKGNKITVSLPGGGNLSIKTQNGLPSGLKSIVFGIRPEHLEITNNSDGIPVTVNYAEHLGGVSYIYGKLSSGENITVESPLGREAHKGGGLMVSIPTEKILLFQPDGPRIR